MLFRIIVLLLAFVFPLGIYYIYWRLFFNKNIHTKYQKFALTFAFSTGFLIIISYLFYLSQINSGNTDGIFVPAMLDENGHIIQSHIKNNP